MRQPTAVLSRNMERRWRSRASRYLREISPNDSCASMLETGPGLSRGGCLQTLLKVFTGGGQDLLFKASDRGDRDGIGRFSSLDLQNHLSLQVR